MKEMPTQSEKIKELLTGKIVVINLGVKSFAENLEKQNVEVVHVNWRPPAGGDQEMMDILENLL